MGEYKFVLELEVITENALALKKKQTPKTTGSSEARKVSNQSHPDTKTLLKAQKTFASHGLEEGKIETVIRLRGRKK